MHLMRTFCFAKMHLMQKCIFATHQQNVTNAFDAKMHLMLPLHFVYKMLESGKMHFCVHFPKENVQLCKNAFDAKMHFCVHFPKENVQHHIFQRKMFSITFSFGKCSASHFPKENVQHQQNVMLCFALLCFAKIHFCIKYIFASNTFLHQIHFCIKYIFASNTFLHCLCFLLCKKHSSIKYIFASNRFDAKMYLMQKCILAVQKCICNILLC